MSSTWKFYDGAANRQDELVLKCPASVTEGTIALNSAYTYGSAGAASFFTIFSQESANLTDFWVKVKSYSGTWASTDGKINVEIREGLNGSNIPGTTLVGSFTITLDGSTTGWIKKTGLAIALTAGKMYSVVVADADGSATNNVTLAVRYGVAPNESTDSGTVVTTSNGFSTGGSGNGSGPAFVMRVGTILYSGNGFDTLATVTSGTYERGMRFQPNEDCTLVGINIANDMTLLTSGYTYKLYDDSTAVGGTTLTSYTPPSSALGSGTSPIPTILPLPAANRYDLKGGTWYLLVVLPSSATTLPRKGTIGGGPDSDVLAAMMPFGNAHWVDASSGSWDKTQTSSLPLFGPVIVPKTASGSIDNFRGGRIR